MYLRVVLTVKNPLKSSQMKTIFKSAMLLASALVVFSSCLKEQTALSIEDIPGSAKVMGILTFNKGQAYEGGKFIELKEVAAGVEVIVKVDNASLSPNGNATGTTDYATTTDENGVFEVIIPAVDGGVTYEIFAPSFQGVKKELSASCMKENELVFEENEGVFEFRYTGANSLYPGSVEVVNQEYSFKPFASTKTLSTYVDFIVAVGKGIAAKTTVENVTSAYQYEYKGELEPADNADVILEVEYGDDYDGAVRYYGATTDKDGLAVFSIPATSVEAMSEAWIDVNVKSFKGDGEFEYFSWNNELGKESSFALADGEYYYSMYYPNDNYAAYYGSYDFEFFTNVVKVAMVVFNNNMTTSADENTGINAEKYDAYNYLSDWHPSKFDLE